MSSLINKGTGYAISASTTANTINTGSNVNTWQFTNPTSVVAVVNVYPSNSNVTLTTGVVVAPNASVVVTGDFGAAYGGNVYVSANLASSTGTIYAVPVAQLN